MDYIDRIKITVLADQLVQSKTTVDIADVINGLVELIANQGTDIVDVDNVEYRLKDIKYNSNDDEVYFHTERR